MTSPAEYISGRTVQEQMNQLISYVDTRSAEVAVDAIASDMATLAQAVQDAQDAQAAAEQARDTAVSTVSDCVKMTPAAAQTITGQDLIVSGADVQAVDLRASGNLTVGGTGAFTGAVTVPTEATGTYSTKAANSTKVKNELDAYAAMLRTTGNQTKSGVLTLAPNAVNELIIQRTNDDITTAPGSNIYSSISLADGNATNVSTITRYHYTNGQSGVSIDILSQGGSRASVSLQINPDGGGFFRVNKPDGTYQYLSTW